ncbi:MAG: phosphoglycolate phosphatase [Idiomarina sp.]|nr:phosphoglycolate phosphatase [Idiomarina sp.]
MTQSAVLFDLDGTLLDTAADLGAALNQMLTARGLAPLPADIIRPMASHGSNGLLKLGFGDAFNETTKQDLREEFLALYEQALCENTCLFPGMSELLNALAEQSIAVGIVTNKPTRYTLPVVAQFSQLASMEVVICGDTLAVAKPHPAPLLLAAEHLRVKPEHCWYLGDAERDIQAGRHAGMRTVLVNWGYLGHEDQPEQWLADYRIEVPQDLMPLL